MLRGSRSVLSEVHYKDIVGLSDMIRGNKNLVVALILGGVSFMEEQKIKNRLEKKRFSAIYTELVSISIFEILERELIEGRQRKLESFHSICSIT